MKCRASAIGCRFFPQIPELSLRLVSKALTPTPIRISIVADTESGTVNSVSRLQCKPCSNIPAKRSFQCLPTRQIRAYPLTGTTPSHTRVLPRRRVFLAALIAPSDTLRSSLSTSSAPLECDDVNREIHAYSTTIMPRQEWCSISLSQAP
jgi:hypothetical protein